MRPMLLVIIPVSTPVEVVPSGNVQDVTICGISCGPLNLSEESMTRVGESVTLALSSLSEVSVTRADRASLDFSEESMTRVGESVTLALPSLSEVSVTRASSTAAS